MAVNEELLVFKAREALEFSYSPYSSFKVGAALLSGSGKIYTGCNIENASFSPTNCAERTAFFKAISEGERDFEAIAVAAEKNGETKNPFFPCGVCRQVMREFCRDDFIILVADKSGFIKMKLSELLPNSFGPENLG